MSVSRRPAAPRWRTAMAVLGLLAVGLTACTAEPVEAAKTVITKKMTRQPIKQVGRQLFSRG